MDALLEISDVRATFGGLHALDGATFNVGRGKTTGLIGPNGAGKSTLFNAISGLYRPKAGSVRIGATEPPALAPEKLVAAGLVRSFQLARGFPKLSVFQHLMLYGAGQPVNRCWRRCSSAGGAGTRGRARRARLRASRRLASTMSWTIRSRALSGGQKKLVEIGRALMAEPKDPAARRAHGGRQSDAGRRDRRSSRSR
jgi:ABC-type branched-subunit amino acid transport system ATPase component